MLWYSTDTLADTAAKFAKRNSPYVTITTTNPLPAQLQLSQNQSNQSIKTQLLIVNNGITYLYLLNTSNASKKYEEVISVASNDIKTIIYYDPKLQKAK